MTISALPTPPTRQDPSNFVERADTFLAALPTFVTEANNFIGPVNANASNINAVAGSIANVNTVATNMSSITTVNSNSANINAVAGSIANVSTVATNMSSITTVNSNSANINAVATNITNVNAAGANATGINAVAANLNLIQDAVDGLPSLAGKAGQTSQTGALVTPSGTTAQRPTPVAGYIRFNEDLDSWEGYDGSQWTDLGGSAEFPDQTSQAGKMLITDGTDVSWSTQINSLGVGVTPVSNEVRCVGAVRAFSTSDYRLKENVSDIEDALDKIQMIRGVNFDWTDEYLDSVGGADGFFVKKNDVGVIAQELEQVLPEAVVERQDGYLSVDYPKIIPLLIQAIKQQQKQIADLRKG